MKALLNNSINLYNTNMKKMTKKQVVTAAIKIAKEATKSLNKILNDNDMFFDPINMSWNDGAIDHSNDIDGNWENVKIRNIRNVNDMFLELCGGDDGYVEENLKTRSEIEQYIKERQYTCSPANRIKKMQAEINRLKEKYNIKD